MPALLSVQEAQTRIVKAFQPVPTELVPLEMCAGRILAQDVQAPGDLPPFTNSSMDGFAVRSRDVDSATPSVPVILSIIADIPAGSSAQVQLQAGQAARIMTGAPIPTGADAVVPVEDTDFAPGLDSSLPTHPAPLQVQIYHPARSGANTRPRGQDVRQGQVLLRAGHIIQPQDAGMLASVGMRSVQVYRRPRIALFSSGDELVQPGSALGPGQIYDSNQYVLAALLEREGAEILRLGTSPDQPEMIQNLLRRGVDEGTDLIVTSAGVSVGAFDYVRQVIEAQGALEFWKVNMRPGKPLAFGSFAGTPFIGLPGNPVSAFVCCMVFVLPALYRLSGRNSLYPTFSKARLAEQIESDGRESYLRAIVQIDDGIPTARLTGHQGSGNLYSLVQANALLIVPSGVKSLPSGSQVDIWFFNTG